MLEINSRHAASQSQQQHTTTRRRFTCVNHAYSQRSLRSLSGLSLSLSLCSFTGQRTVGGDEDAALKVFERLEPLTPLLLVEPAVDAQRREVALDEQLRERLRALDRLDEDDNLGGKEREGQNKEVYVSTGTFTCEC